MVARKFSIRAKLELFSEFPGVFEQDIGGLLHCKTGFKGQIVLAPPGSRDTSGDADAYHNSVQTDMLTVLSGMIEPSPRIGAPDVLHTTLYESHAAVSGV